MTPGLGAPGSDGASASLIQRTVERISTLVPIGGVRVVTTRDQGPMILDALPGLAPSQLILEPAGKNTAACVALAVASCLREESPDTLLYLLPADHHVGDIAAFNLALARAGAVARAHDTICTLGIAPSRPHTGYGYIQHEPSPLPGDATPPAFAVRRFTEKPDEQTARAMLAQGDHLWNAGVFVGTTETFSRELACHCEVIWEAVVNGLNDGDTALDEAYAALPSIPVDVALMERLQRMFVVPCDADWSDLGSWRAVFEHLKNPPDPPDPNNVRVESGEGRAILEDATGNLVWAEDATVAVLGVHDLAVIAVGQRVLVCSIERADEIKRLVQQATRKQH